MPLHCELVRTIKKLVEPTLGEKKEEKKRNDGPTLNAAQKGESVKRQEKETPQHLPPSEKEDKTQGTSTKQEKPKVRSPNLPHWLGKKGFHP